jgi:hypothetical protein
MVEDFVDQGLKLEKHGHLDQALNNYNQALEADPAVVAHLVRVPLPLVQQWALPASFMRRRKWAVLRRRFARNSPPSSTR